jgi:nucleotide-binding universal stress UspA family protein
MKKIVLPTDGSDNAVLAGRFAAELAREERAEILVVSVAEPAVYYGVEDPAVTAAIREAATRVADEEVVRLQAEGISAEAVVVEAEQVFKGILSASENCRADIIVMGTHGRSALSRALIGSTADKMVRHARVPVLLVPSIRGRSPEGEES